jgi:hypothetical protein
MYMRFMWGWRGDYKGADLLNHNNLHLFIKL